MKRILRAGLALTLIFAAVCVTALAADTVTVTANTGYTVTPLDASGAAVQPVDGAYTGVAQFRLSYAANAGEHMVLLLKGGSVPTANNLYYIDQATQQSAGTAEFTLYPKTLTDGRYYLLVVHTGSTEAAQVVYKAEYVLGDVDGANGVNATDATWTLQAVVGKRTLTDTQRLAADVDKKNGVNATDATYILQYVVGKLSDFSRVQ